MTTHEPRGPERSDLFGSLPAIDDETTRRLHDRLVREAQTAGLLDVAYRTIDSPVGPLLLAATAKGLVRVAYRCEDHEEVLERLARDLSPRILHAPARLDAAAKEIDEYFAGLRQGFDLPVDYSLSRGFRRLVLTRLRAIGYGQTASYAAIAVAAGNPKAVRAVGTACATNPSPLSCPATAWCAATAQLASTSAASTRKRRSSPWRAARPTESGPAPGRSSPRIDGAGRWIHANHICLPCDVYSVGRGTRPRRRAVFPKGRK